MPLAVPSAPLADRFVHPERHDRTRRQWRQARDAKVPVVCLAEPGYGCPRAGCIHLPRTKRSSQPSRTLREGRARIGPLPGGYGHRLRFAGSVMVIRAATVATATLD